MSMLERLKDGAKNIIGITAIPIPISSGMLKRLLLLSELEEISNLDVQFYDDSLQISGKVTKVVAVPFTIVLRPERSDQRKVYFSVIRMSPMNLDWLNGKIFNSPPLLSYHSKTICVDFNGFEPVAKVPVGTIKSFEIKNNTMWVHLGV